jgi:hypothetical protein
LFLGFETICSNFTGLWYGQEQVGYPALLIRLESCNINICAADISQKVISLQLKEYTLTEWQFHVPHILLHSHSHNSTDGEDEYKIFNSHCISVRHVVMFAI